MSNAFKFKYKGTKVHTLVDLYTKEAEDMADMETKKAHGWVVRLIMEGYGRKHAEKRTLMLVDMGIGPFQDMEWQRFQAEIQIEQADSYHLPYFLLDGFLLSNNCIDRTCPD